jgi:hypothetical protein
MQTLDLTKRWNRSGRSCFRVRQIAATFLCGFVVVFAGLRLASSLNDLHQALPVMSADAAPLPAEAAADPELRRGQSAVPVLYDMRFVSNAGTLAPVLTNLAPFPEVAASESAAMPDQPTADKPSAVAAIDPQQPAEATAAAAPSFDILVPEAAEVDRSPSATDVVATATPAVTPPTPPSAIDIPMPEPATIDLSPSATDLASPTSATALPIAKAKPPLEVRAKVMRKKTRTARRAEQNDLFADPFSGIGNSGAYGASK